MILSLKTITKYIQLLAENDEYALGHDVDYIAKQLHEGSAVGCIFRKSGDELDELRVWIQDEALVCREGLILTIDDIQNTSKIRCLLTNEQGGITTMDFNSEEEANEYAERNELHIKRQREIDQTKWNKYMNQNTKIKGDAPMFTEQQKETIIKVFDAMYQQGEDEIFHINELAKKFQVTQEKITMILRAMKLCKYIEEHKEEDNTLRVKLTAFGIERYQSYLNLQELQQHLTESINEGA